LIVLGPAAAPALATLHRLAFDEPWSAAEFTALLDSPGVFALSADVGDETAGFILCRLAADEGEVLTLAVAPSLRRGGVASGLLARALDILADRGAATAFLEVAIDNPGAVALYQRYGFVRVGLRKAYYSRPCGAVDAIILRRDLNR